ncbi:MaoC family dehydratase [Sediminicurvatus halobius]|uniref:MaoC-like domain-containing protein n=1 Tax=Sediminicurvatus halobius TaxID=2182432 RepID=A0A2U2N1R5_9GAMM|nr:MaoC family dehydratase [Spiribacter halobius]PWG62998.1 hypothetical protein DEM34_10420 [Spiribacter halobius]UEX77517.1 MaoC family dehydratase [Spiribacter halobius]
MDGYVFEDLEIGLRAGFAKTVTEADVGAFAGITGDFNPVHINAEYAKGTNFHGRIAHGLLTAGLISAVLGTRLPGPGAVYLNQQLCFHAPVFIGDTVTAEVTVRELDAEHGFVTLDTTARVRERAVISGEALVRVPRRQELQD